MKWALLALLVLAATASRAAEPFARVAVEGNGNIVAGEQLRLDVTVFVPDFFTSPPQFPLFDIPNALVTLPDERAQNVVETIDGIQYSGIRRAYAIVPETSGSFALPPVSITLGYSVEGKPVRGEARMPAFGFTVAPADSLSGSTMAFAARNLTLAQSFDGNPASLRVGDALVRTITVLAENTQAIMIPAVDIGEVAGAKQYTATPRIDDNVAVDRRRASRRVQTVTYIVESAGHFVIPAISYAWYDTDQRHLSRATLPATTLNAAAAARPAEGIVPVMDVGRDGGSRVERALASALLLVMVGACIWSVWRLRHRLSSQLRRGIYAFRNSDRQRLARLSKTIRSAEPQDIEAGLRRWSCENGYSSLADWSTQHADLRTQVEGLQGLLYNVDHQPVAIDRERLLAAVLTAGRRRVQRPYMSRLPALNPRSNRDERLR